MTNYIFLGFLALWVIGLIIAFVIGMHGDIKNNKDTSPLNMRYVKNQFIFGVIELIGGIVVLIIDDFSGSGYIAIWCFASGTTNENVVSLELIDAEVAVTFEFAVGTTPYGVPFESSALL